MPRGRGIHRCDDALEGVKLARDPLVCLLQPLRPLACSPARARASGADAGAGAGAGSEWCVCVGGDQRLCPRF
jgi:hypothetical protein